MTAERTLMIAAQAGQGGHIVNNALALYALAGIAVLFCALGVTCIFYLFVYFVNYLISKIKNVKKK